MGETMRSRFDRLRKVMKWSWKDIDRITGRKNARTNISKRVPAWAHLAIEVHERYEVLLRQHVVKLLSVYLGNEWSMKLLGNDFYFVRDGSTTANIAGVNLRFYSGGFELASDTSIIYELAERFRSLYPDIGKVMRQEDNFVVSVPIALDVAL